MKSFIFLMISSLSAFVCSIGFANGKPDIETVGFSASGKYFAYERFGVEDATGSSYSTIFIMDLETNTYANTPIHGHKTGNQDQTTDLALIRSLARKRAQRALKQRGILSTPGKLLLYRPTTDIGGKGAPARFSFFDIIGGFVSQDYQLKLTEVPVPELPSHCLWAKEWLTTGVKMLELSLFQTARPDVSQSLQADKSLPTSRGCPLGYTIESVISAPRKPTQDNLADTSVVVFVRSNTDGHGGESMDYVAIGATLKVR